MLLRKKLIFILISVAVVLLVVNTSLDYIDGERSDQNAKSVETTVDQIEKTFYSLLYKYGIIDKWINVRKISDVNYDSLNHVFFIDVPPDLPIAILINDFNQELKYSDAEISSEEKKNFGNSSVNVIVNNITKLQAHFNITEKVVRETTNFSFIAKLSSSMEKKELIDILNRLPIEPNILITPGENSIKIISALDSLGIKYSILINDYIDSDSFELEPGMSKERLQRSIVTILANFGRQSAYIVDDNSEIYNSIAYNFIRDELINRNVRIFLLSEFINLNSNSEDEMKSLFDFHCVSSKVNEHKLFLIDLEKLDLIKQNILLEKTKGNKFVQPFN